MQGPEGPELELTWTSPSRGLVFTVPEGAIQAFRGEKQWSVMFSFDAYEPQQRVALNVSFQGAVVTFTSGW